MSSSFCYRIGEDHYKKALEEGPESIIETDGPVAEANVCEIAPGEYWLSYIALKENKHE